MVAAKEDRHSKGGRDSFSLLAVETGRFKFMGGGQRVKGRSHGESLPVHAEVRC